ncbi:RNA-binding protein 7 [Cynoglossus semilaevis]|uniref:RNA binding motif protein 7 n=1 Tax=Cynoglossus semilaevis TaxID=244447 RepID=A0A3P8ULP6_CYNSE|nr:RNA-binding protein 7-like [Cynoglossus semilaevis]
MGIADETDRTLFIRNLDSRVTEELLFELFLQAGPLIKTKIPKDPEGKPKTFGFAVYRHEVSVPYAVQLLNGISLFGRNIHVQFRSGSSHGNSPGNAQLSSPGNIPSPHGHRAPDHFSSPPSQPSRSYSGCGSLQKHVMVNNMRQAHMQQLEYQNGSYSKSMQSQLSPAGHSGSSRQHSNAHYQQHLYHSNSGSRNHRFSEEPGPSRHQQSGHGRDNYSHQGDRSSNRQQQSRGSYRPQDNRGGSGHSDNRWRRY